MYAPIFETVKESAAAVALLGSDPTRFWPFGEGDERPELPYAVWQTVYGSPQNYISNVPDADSFGIQIDVYAAEASDAREVAEAIRSAVEPIAHVTAYNGEFRDVLTRHYRYSFTVDWIINR